MAVITPNEGEKLLLAITLGQANWASWTCMLYKNDITPSPTTIYSDLTPGNFSGYNVVDITWASVTGNASGQAESLGSVCVFTRDSQDPGTNNTIYGWAVVGSDSRDGQTKIIAIENLASPKAMNVFMDQITVTPKLTLQSVN